MMVLGAVGVGKSALTIQYTQNRFVDDWDPTVDNYYRVQSEIDQGNYQMSIYDSAPMAGYLFLLDQTMREVDGFILIYSVTSRSTFDEMDSFREYATRVKDCAKVPMVLVGNKCDLEDERQVTTNEGIEMGRVFDCAMFETSAKFRVNVEEIFYQLAREVRVAHDKDKGMEGNTKKTCLLM